MIEMILSHLCDAGMDFSDYPEALQHFFTYVARRRLAEEDSVSPTTMALVRSGRFREPVQIIDPVNVENNVAKLYSDVQADAIVDAALEAGDAIDAALAAPTKGETVRYWRKVLGSSFQA